MPKRALRCIVELDIHAVSSPGVWLTRRNDIYLAVKLFGQRRRSALCAPIFPILFNEKFRFDKVFYTAYSPGQVTDALAYETIEIELIQLSEVREEGRLLGCYESSARQFLYPYSTVSSNYGTHDRELLLERAYDYPGIAPKLEFSTRAIIQDTLAPTLDPYEDVQLIKSWEKSLTPRSKAIKYRRRSKCKSPSRRSRLRHRRPTVASVSRSRSPSLDLQFRKLRLDDRDFPLHSDDDRPPFVVSKVKEDLIGRIPGSSKTPRGVRTPQTPRSKSPGLLRRSRSRDRAYYYLDDGYKSKPWYSTVRFNDTVEVSQSESDDDVQMSEYQRYARRYRSPSPTLLSSSFADRFDDQYKYSHRISDRVSSALRRNKSLESLDKIGASYLDDLDLTLDRSRRRENTSISKSLREATYHRDDFNRYMNTIYKEMYDSAIKLH